MDDARFEHIVRTHGESLARVAWGYVQNAADHDDLMQDILVAIWQALPRFRAESSERTFVFRVAHNRGCTFAARRRERLLAAVRTLPEAQRQAVLLRLEGFELSEIAALQGASENNVSVRLTRARERLRELLGDDDR